MYSAAADRPTELLQDGVIVTQSQELGDLPGLIELKTRNVRLLEFVAGFRFRIAPLYSKR